MHTPIKWITAITIAFGLAGCPPQSIEKTTEPEQLEQAVEQPPDDLEPSARVRKAIQDLQIGEQESARKQLRWALMTDPKHRIANDLLDQLDADPVERLGKEKFSYTVQPGDTLSLIAKIFLTDALKFVILGRYNDIQNPSQISAGQTIQIPGKRRAVETASMTGDQAGNAIKPEIKPEVHKQVGELQPARIPDSQTPAKRSEDNLASDYDRAKELYDAGNLDEVVPFLETVIDTYPESAGIRELLISSYSNQADQFIEEKKFPSARTNLEKAVNLDPSNEHLISRLTNIEDEIEADRLFVVASRLADEGRLEKAYQTYSQVLVYSPDHASAQQEHKRVGLELAEQYHRQGMQLFRQHKLDEAIAYWDKVLEINPDHNLAPGYRARALELKKQLKRLQNR